MPDPIVQKEVLAVLVRDTPQALWQEFVNRKRWAYSEAFASVANDSRILPNQKPAKLLDERFYLCERALHDGAIASGAVSSGQMVAINRWVYTIVRSGSVSLIQTYVPTPQEFARPAKFREQHAALNDFLSKPQLALGDVPPALFDISSVAGILVHGPVDRAFREPSQRMGFINFCVPSGDYRRWEVSLPLSEILAAYDPAETRPAQRDIAQPKPRDRDADKKDGKGAA